MSHTPSYERPPTQQGKPMAGATTAVLALAMEWSEIEVKGVSCRGLVLPLTLFGKPPVYAVVSLGDCTGKLGRKQSQSTQFDRTGGRNPEWEHHMRFDLAKEGSSGGAIFLEFDFVVRSGTGGILGDRVVGETRIPVQNLVEEYSGDRFRSVSYEVRSPDGKRAGVLSFFYRVGPQQLDQDVNLPRPRPPAPKQQPSSCGRRSTVSYPAIDDPPSYTIAERYHAPPPTYPLISQSDYVPPSLLPPAPATTVEYFRPPLATVHDGTMIPPHTAPSGVYGYPAVVYGFQDGGLSSAPALLAGPPETYGYTAKGYDLAAGEAWCVDGNAGVWAYGPVSRFS